MFVLCLDSVFLLSRSRFFNFDINYIYKLLRVHHHNWEKFCFRLHENYVGPLFLGNVHYWSDWSIGRTDWTEQIGWNGLYTARIRAFDANVQTVAYIGTNAVTSIGEQ